MDYRLKVGQESFVVVDGPFAKKKFERGKTYTEIPPEEKRRFEEIGPSPAPAIRKAAQKDLPPVASEAKAEAVKNKK